ncbi:MAG: OB-fold nucleic acid binding domain-containing protein, partial [Planctomycetota bacterium]
TYPNEAIREVLHKTLGVPLFQEQAMRLAVVAAGFTPGEADRLRRAMGAWRKTGVIDKFRRQMLVGMRTNGLSEEFADRLFNQLRGFGEYGFPESHAASFALLVYVSAWLKRHYPAAFTAALLNSQPMGFYAPAQLVRNLREHGGETLPVDVNHSLWDCTLERASVPSSFGRRPPNAMRLGFRLLSGMSESAAERIVEARRQGPFSSVDQFTQRTQLGRGVVERLAEADAFASLNLDRRAALWEALDQQPSVERLPLFQSQVVADDPPAALPLLTDRQQVFADYRTAGLSLRAHPLSFHREQLRQLGATPAVQLMQRKHDTPVCVAGLVLMRQRPSTAKGITFVTLEDETGVANLVIHVQIWERFYKVARRSSAMIAHGRLERKGQVIHVVVKRLQDLAEQLDRLPSQSRDFR